MLEYSLGSCCSQSQRLSTVVARRRLQAAAGRRSKARDGEQNAFRAPGACATEGARKLRPFSKIILFHFMMQPRVKYNSFRTVDRRRRLGSEIILFQHGTTSEIK